MARLRKMAILDEGKIEEMCKNIAIDLKNDNIQFEQIDDVAKNIVTPEIESYFRSKNQNPVEQLSEMISGYY